jgi:hypothetical protein
MKKAESEAVMTSSTVDLTTCSLADCYERVPDYQTSHHTNQ